MNTYFEGLKKEVKEYFNILSPEFPEWLVAYIETPPMQRLKTIKSNSSYYSSLDHCVGGALITWHFTHDKKQTLSGLFHNIMRQ